MMDFENLLYHGSYCEIRHPDIRKGKGNRDFGQGFYLTTSREQAESFLPLSIRKHGGFKGTGNTYGYISAFRLHYAHRLNIYSFADADEAWLNCIVAHRRRKDGIFNEIVERYQSYDAIVGKVANDDTNATILTYMSGVFGAIGSQEAIRICISLLRPERLKDQICLRTERALSLLEFVGSEKIYV